MVYPVRLSLFLSSAHAKQSRESNIIFLAYLVAHRGLLSLHRAFPSIKVVTAAIDNGLDEMHFPLFTLSMGEAVGEADFATRLVDDSEDIDDRDDDRDGTEQMRRVLDSR